MKNTDIRETYIVTSKGTPILGSVCSFAHDHAIFKMMDLLGQLEDAFQHVTYNVNVITCGKEGILPVEHCEARIDFEIPAGAAKEQVQDRFDELIRNTGYQGISYEIMEGQ